MPTSFAVCTLQSANRGIMTPMPLWAFVGYRCEITKFETVKDTSKYEINTTSRPGDDEALRNGRNTPMRACQSTISAQPSRYDFVAAPDSAAWRAFEAFRNSWRFA